MIVFNTLKIVGFQGQVEFKTFKLDQPGLNVITGKNGCGKSTIFNALSWALYGKPLKEKASIETWEQLQGEDYQGTMVTVSLIIGKDKYKITRCKKYKGTIHGAKGGDRLVLDRNGEFFPPNIKDKRDIQRAITEILGMSYELFINTVIFPQRVIRFIESTGAEKKKILEQSFNLTWLNDMAAKAKEERLQYISLASEQAGKMKSISDRIAEIDKMLTQIEKSKGEFFKDKAETINEITKNITTLEEKSGSKIQAYEHIRKTLTELEARQDLLEKDKLVTEYDSTQREVQDLLPKRDSAKRKYEAAVTALKNLKDSTKCTACGQEIPKKDLAKHRRTHSADRDRYYEHYNNYVAQITPLEEDLINGQAVKAELVDTQKDIKEARKLWDEKENERLLIEGAKGQLLELRKRLKAEEEREFNDISPPLKKNKYLAEQVLKKEEKKLSKINRVKKLYAWVSNGPLSNSGIKAFLFDNLLEALNNRVVYYERFTGVGVELEVDMQGSRKDINTIVTKDGYPVAYYDLSGGEAQLVNTVMALGQNDILTAENPSNLYVMDEVFEGLDPDNIDVVGSLLQDKAENKSLFVITHNNAFIPQNANLIRMSNGQ